MESELNNESLHLYLRVYNYYKNLIETGKLDQGSKLPSIRTCAVQLQFSRTTVETAYMMLAADGYIISRPQSGFYVTEQLGAIRREQSTASDTKKVKDKIEFDFAAPIVDRD
ncbi:MAG: winged helix-turn-helix domain-containing protein, partial [Clostridium sp.]